MFCLKESSHNVKPKNLRHRIISTTLENVQTFHTGEIITCDVKFGKFGRGSKVLGLSISA